MTGYERVAIVGVGLLGGSIGLALQQRKLAGRVIGIGRSTTALDQALAAGAIEEVSTDIATGCRDADLVVVCTPVHYVADQVRACADVLAPGACVTDVGSTKSRICQELSDCAHLFCGSHPLAGSDKSGVAHARADLFQGRQAVITPLPTTPPSLADRAAAFWQLLGSETRVMSPAEHDEAVARTSHLPHLLAAALAKNTPQAVLPLAASGWCDTTRVAAGGVEMWTQILQDNRQAVASALRDFKQDLDSWLSALEANDSEQLQHLLSVGKQQRDSVGN